MKNHFKENTMKKLLLIALLAAAVAGCSNSVTTLTFPALPAEFADCKIVRVGNTTGDIITVARCPNSTTSTTTSGKHSATVITVDGVEYAPTAPK